LSSRPGRSTVVDFWGSVRPLSLLPILFIVGFCRFFSSFYMVTQVRAIHSRHPPFRCGRVSPTYVYPLGHSVGRFPCGSPRSYAATSSPATPLALTKRRSPLRLSSGTPERVHPPWSRSTHAQRLPVYHALIVASDKPVNGVAALDAPEVPCSSQREPLNSWKVFGRDGLTGATVCLDIFDFSKWPSDIWPAANQGLEP